MANLETDTIRHLTEKFFNATISDAESERLFSYVREFSAHDIKLKETDPELLRDLRFISSLLSFSQAANESVASQTPAGLEARLEQHISMLASGLSDGDTAAPDKTATARKRLSFRRILPYVSAAAVAAIAATIGWGILTGNKTSLSPDSSRYALANTDFRPSDSTASGVSAESPAMPNTITAPKAVAPAIITTSPAQSNLREAAGPAAKVVTSGHSSPASEPVFTPAEPKANMESIVSKINIPAFSDPVIDVMPMLAAATIDPSKLVLQPISTLSQTVCNVYESVDDVSSSFAGISEALDMVSSALSFLSPSAMEIQ